MMANLAFNEVKFIVARLLCKKPVLGNISQVNAFFEFTSLITKGAITNFSAFLKKWKMVVITKLALIFEKRVLAGAKFINKLILKCSRLLFMVSLGKDYLKTIVIISFLVDNQSNLDHIALAIN